MFIHRTSQCYFKDLSNVHVLVPSVFVTGWRPFNLPFKMKYQAPLEPLLEGTGHCGGASWPYTSCVSPGETPVRCCWFDCTLTLTLYVEFKWLSCFLLALLLYLPYLSFIRLLYALTFSIYIILDIDSRITIKNSNFRNRMLHNHPWHLLHRPHHKWWHERSHQIRNTLLRRKSWNGKDMS